MIKLYHNPFLLDFIKVCAKMPDDERAQSEAFSGQEYSVDRVAVAHFTAPGPKWVGKLDDETPIFIGGFIERRPGVWHDFMINTPTAWEHWFQTTRICRRVMDAMLMTDAHRLQTVVPVPRLTSRPELVRWYKVLGYNREALLHGYCANGADAVVFSRVKH